MIVSGHEFDEVWVVDFEFSAPDGERPRPVCLVARELGSGRLLRIGQDELARLPSPPYATGRDNLFVAFYASADIGCHLALGWPVPVNVLDPFVEFRNLGNGKQVPSGFGLIGALVYFGLDSIAATEKKTMRALAMRGGPYTSEEMLALLDYCQSDVDALAGLLPCMMPQIDMPRALLRGRYMAAAARIEHTGIPIDMTTLAGLRANWDSIQDELICRIDRDYGVFEGRTFKKDRFAAFLSKVGIPWVYLPSGQLALDDKTFRDMAKIHSLIAPLRELRVSLSQMRLSNLAVGSDGRNRCLLSAFHAKTGRNQPSNSRLIFGPAVWVRGLIQPSPGYGVAYVDWSQQEFGIAAALSGDEAMMAAYASGDPYLEFAKQARAVPPDATKKTHAAVRDQYKQCVLAVQYGMGAESLALRIGQPTPFAEELLQMHRRTYPQFWKWSEGAVDCAMLHGQLNTVFGWTIHTGPDANARSLVNFPMQGNGAEMLRLACSLVTEAGVRVCAPVHDAILVEAPLDRLAEVVGATQALMARASEIVLNGFTLRSDAKVVCYPERYMDERGQKMWDTVQAILAELGA